MVKDYRAQDRYGDMMLTRRAKNGGRVAFEVSGAEPINDSVDLLSLRFEHELMAEVPRGHEKLVVAYAKTYRKASTRVCAFMSKYCI